MTAGQEPGWSRKKWLAFIAILALIWMLLWILHYAGSIKPIY